MECFLSYHRHLKSLFGTRIYKVSVDGDFTCPNRDGTKSFKGCIFCDETGSSSRTQGPMTSISIQVKKNIIIRKTRYRAKKFIVYFQSFSNTYAPISILKKKYDEAVFAHEDIVGLSISTRPDCMDSEKLALIASYKKHLPYVCVEYGLQTMHNKTLSFINRQETYEHFLSIYEETKKHDIDVCAHVILGLPGETLVDQLKTADELARLKVAGVKIHILVAMENTHLSSLYKDKKWLPMSLEEAVFHICSFLERLHPTCIIHRLGGNGHPMHTVAPKWVCKQKKNLLLEINNEFKKRGSKQGSKCKF